MKRAAPATPAGSGPVPAPLPPLRINSYVFAVLFAVACTAVFLVWWGNYPISYELLSEYWLRDRRHLRLDWGPMLKTWRAGLYATVLLIGFEVASLGLGSRSLSWVFRRKVPGLWGALFALGIGKGVIGTSVLALGLAGLLTRGALAVFFVAAVVSSVALLAGPVVSRFKSFGPPVLLGVSRAIFVEVWRTSVVGWALLLVSLLVVAGNFLPAWEPEWFYDSLVYHLAVPEQYLIEHKICRLGHTFFSNFPFLQEMQYTLLMALGPETAGKLLHWADGTLAAVAVYALARPFVSRTGALLAAAVLLSQPTLRFLQHVTMVELGVTFFEILAVMAFLRGAGWLAGNLPGPDQRAWRRWLFTAGWLLGLSQGTKYLGVFCSGILVCFWVVAIRSWGGIPRRVLRLSGVLIMVGWGSVWTVPWLAKNWAFTGDPFFPMLQNVFPALNWDQGLYDRWMFDNAKYGTGHGSLFKILTMPLYACIDSASFGTFTLNLFPLMFLPLVALYRSPPAAVKFLAIYSGVYFLVWSLTSQQARFLFPMVAQAALPVAFVITNLGRGSRLVRAVLFAAAAWILIVCAWGQVHNRFTNRVLWPFMFGHMGREDILRIGVSYYDTVRRVNEEVKPGNRVLFIGSDENLYCRYRRICSSIYDRSAAGELARISSSRDDLLRRLKRLRVTHILIHEPRAEEYATRGSFEWGGEAVERFLGVWREHGRLVSYARGVFLFELTEDRVPAAERKKGRPAYFYPVSVIQQSHQLTTRADKFFASGRTKEAYRVCDDLVRLLPEASYVYSYRAYARSHFEKIKDAIADYEKAIELGYPPPMVYYNLGLLLEDEKRYARALKMHLMGVRITPSLHQARRRAFDLALRLERHVLALKLGEELLASDPQDLELRDTVGRLRAIAPVGGEKR